MNKRVVIIVLVIILIAGIALYMTASPELPADMLNTTSGAPALDEDAAVFDEFDDSLAGLS